MSKKKKKNAGSHFNVTRVIVKNEKGEIVSDITDQKDYQLYRAEKRWFNVFDDFVLSSTTIGPVGIRALMFMCMKAEMNTNDILFSPTMTSDMSKCMGYSSTKSIPPIITDLRRKDIVRRTGRSSYKINPKYCFKGSLDKVKKVNEQYWSVVDEITNKAILDAAKLAVEEAAKQQAVNSG